MSDLTKSLEKSIQLERMKNDVPKMLKYIENYLCTMEGDFDNDPKIHSDEEWEEYINAARFMNIHHNRSSWYINKVMEHINELPY
jgi:hypothetical protein